ncbi:hypothetical protein RN001_005448 [Aquatica leii]|uniref:Uncharacterized protein n=1 Tax=Aquatica leii TaxID=1421715 RepID=A0AAN7PCG5_9COLE|nr:hypothetical protein RN001_005448 [Aquatica leii]
MSDNSYVVVYDLTILDGEQYSIVLYKWLHEKDNITYLSYSTLKEYQKCLKIKRYPDKLWKMTAVAIDNYDEAKKKENNLLQYKSSSGVDDESSTFKKGSLRKHKTTKIHYFRYEDDSLMPSPSHARYNLLKNVYDKLVKCEILLESHTDRLIKIERHLNIAPVHHEVTSLSMELPLKTLEDIEMFEISLLNDAQFSALLQVLKRTDGKGGSTTLSRKFKCYKNYVRRYS